MQLHITPSIFIGRTVRSESSVIKFIFFSEKPLYENYSTLDSHTKTVTNHQSKVAELKSLLFGASKIGMKNGQTIDPKASVCPKE